MNIPSTRLFWRLLVLTYPSWFWYSSYSFWKSLTYSKVICFSQLTQIHCFSNRHTELQVRNSSIYAKLTYLLKCCFYTFFELYITSFVITNNINFSFLISKDSWLFTDSTCSCKSATVDLVTLCYI